MTTEKYISEEIEIVWLCTKCLKGGTLRFRNHTSVGERLRAGEEQHLKNSPTCPLDWNNVVVQNAVLLPPAH
jgi:hypothetical protein